ncbi:MAG TPA: hypothetical protein VGQ29_09310 [Gemmatimonadales bacterium]|nr:hypothetical protein [Gemmatimonadales bacterium]
MRTRLQTSLIVAALLATGAVPARGQNTTVDARWRAYIGCWEPVESEKSILCVVPTSEASAVELLTIAKGEIVARERIAANGERSPTANGGCRGWQTADWSVHGQRLFLRSSEACPGSESQTGTGMIAMLGARGGVDQWLYLQGMTLAGQTGVRVQRYRALTTDVDLPDEVDNALQLDVSSRIQARALSAAPLATNDVIEASQQVDVPVVEAWLIERGQPFSLDAKGLIKLADAGVPSSVIDLMVALSYPRVFAINGAARQGELRAASRGTYSGGGTLNEIDALDQECSRYFLIHPYSSYDCERLLRSYGYGYGYGYGYPYGWYPCDAPVVIVYTGSGGGGGSGGNARSHGRVVNGQGYTEGSGSGGTRSAEPRPSVWSAPSSGSSATSSTGSTTTSTSSSGEQRTAKPRP